MGKKSRKVRSVVCRPAKGGGGGGAATVPPCCSYHEMCDACEAGNLPEVKRLVEQEEALLTPGNYESDEETVLHLCIRKKLLEILRYLAPVVPFPLLNRRNKEGETPVYMAVNLGDMEALQILNAAEADLNIPQMDLVTPLHLAAIKNNKEAMELLLKSGKTNLEVQGPSGQRPLLMACCCSPVGELATVKLLVEAGGNILARPEDGRTLLHVASEKNHGLLAQYLLQAGGESLLDALDGQGETALLSAVVRGHVDVARVLLSAGADVHRTGNPEGVTALHVAACKGDKEMVELLVKEGKADRRKVAKGSCAGTPLQSCCCHGHVNGVQALLDLGDDIRILHGITGLTLLHIAAIRDRVDIMRVLIRRGLEVDVKIKPSMQTALHVAALEGRMAAVKVLVEEGANVRIPDKDRFTALHKAASGGHVEVVKLLIRQGADVNAKGTRSITPLYGACIDGRLAAAQLLLEEGADWRVAREDGMTIYHAAAFEGKLAVVEFLLEQRLFDVSAKGALGYTALHDAAVEGRIEVCDFLVFDKDLDVETKAKGGVTPLMAAAMHGQYDMVVWLVDKAGANPNVKNDEGKTAYDVAGCKNVMQIISYLEVQMKRQAGRDPAADAEAKALATARMLELEEEEAAARAAAGKSRKKRKKKKNKRKKGNTAAVTAGGMNGHGGGGGKGAGAGQGAEDDDDEDFDFDDEDVEDEGYFDGSSGEERPVMPVVESRSIESLPPAEDTVEREEEVEEFGDEDETETEEEEEDEDDEEDDLELERLLHGGAARQAKAEEDKRKAREMLEAEEERERRALISRSAEVMEKAEDDGVVITADHLICPISFQLLTDPVLAPDCITYQRSAIETWIDKCLTEGKPIISPMTGLRIPGELRTNTLVRSLVTEYLRQRAPPEKPPSPPAQQQQQGCQSDRRYHNQPDPGNKQQQQQQQHQRYHPNQQQQQQGQGAQRNRPFQRKK